MPGKKQKSAKKHPAAGKEPRATDSHPKKYREWSEEYMLGATKSVTCTEGTGIDSAAVEFMIRIG